jgi:intracellular septation protein A
VRDLLKVLVFFGTFIHGYMDAILIATLIIVAITCFVLIVSYRKDECQMEDCECHKQP